MITPARSVATIRAGTRDRGEILFGANSMQHGTAVFEGIRCYRTPDGPAVFRLDEHLARLLRSARLVGIPHPYDLEELRRQVLAAAARSGLADCYLRPVLFAPDPYLGLDLRELTFELATEIWPGGARGEHGGTGIRVTVSRWRRPSARAFPAQAKATGTYAASAVARTEAAAAGFDDAIQLGLESGRVVEATVANVFAVKNGVLRTPWLADDPLAGITRATVLTLAADLGIPAAEGPIEESQLRAADEIFLTGTASELVRVGSIDNRSLGLCGPVFDRICAAFDAAVTGRDSSHRSWLTPVPLVADE